MSGLYLPGMEMPTSCCNCPLAKLSPTGQTLICNYTLSTVPWDDKPFDCPLVPVPPHGDLIDKSGVEVLSWTEDPEKDFADGVLFVLDKLDELPTIIPADKEGEG